jgi:hydroxymethylbilane synthase
MVVCREEDETTAEACAALNDPDTAFCTRTEREFLRILLGGCSTPISALAEIEDDELYFRGHILSLDGREKVEVEKILPLDRADGIGRLAAEELLEEGGKAIADSIRAAAAAPAPTPNNSPS